MLLHLNDITQNTSSLFSNRLVINILNTIRNIIQKLEIQYHSGLLSKLNKRLEKQYINIIGVTTIIERECKEANSIALLLEVRKSIKNIRETYSLLEGVNFFDNSNIRNRSEKILDAMYDLEFIVRKKAFKNKKSSGSANEAEITARLQLEALESDN